MEIATSMFRRKPRPEETYRLAARRRFRGDIDRLRAENQKAGRFPFEGGWRTLDEIARLRTEMVRRDRRIFFELLALFGAMALFALGVGVLTWIVLPW